MAVLTKGAYNCACSREVCDWTCTTYATMMSDLVPNTAPQPFKNLSKPFKSNADRIRQMSDEELADEILRWFNWLNAVEWNDKRILDWLKQEADNGN